MPILIKICITVTGVIFMLKAIGLWPVVKSVLGRWVYEAVMGRPKMTAPPPSRTDVDLCYRLLGLSPSASWGEIQSAYRRKAKVHHPDHGGDEDAMRALNEAYQTLKRVRNA
jgi:hypothetical protein